VELIEQNRNAVKRMMDHAFLTKVISHYTADVVRLKQELKELRKDAAIRAAEPLKKPKDVHIKEMDKVKDEEN
jgi:hypothetical protein